MFFAHREIVWGELGNEDVTQKIIFLSFDPSQVAEEEGERGV